MAKVQVMPTKGLSNVDAKYVVSKDGARIAYTVFGTGPAVLLVHGAGNVDKEVWSKAGWVKALQDSFTVITMDMRGYGGSDTSRDAEFYRIDNILNDIDQVIQACGFQEYRYIGHSCGATIGLHVAKRGDARKVVCAGTCFGDHFGKIQVPQMIKQYSRLNELKELGRLGCEPLDKGLKAWAMATDLDWMIAQARAWHDWPVLYPEDISSQLAIYSGTKDHPPLVNQLQEQEEAMSEHGITYAMFEGLDHRGLIAETTVVLPWILQFLQD